jgi:hypothetical protein
MAKIEILGPVGGQTYSTTVNSDQEAMHKARLIESEFRAKGGLWVGFAPGKLRDTIGPSLVWFPSSSQVRIAFDEEIPQGIDSFS